jgi:hypothetical protein
MSSARSFRSGSGALSDIVCASLGEEQLMDDLTPEQEQAVAATVGAIQRIAMPVVELPQEQRERHYALVRRHFEAAITEFGIEGAMLQCDVGDIILSGHARRGRQHPVGADEIAALSDSLARQPDRLLVVASNELGVGGDAVIDCRERIARAQPQRDAFRQKRIAHLGTAGDCRAAAFQSTPLGHSS